MQLLGMDKTRTTPFHPQSNAVIERMNKNITEDVDKLCERRTNSWSPELSYVRIA